MVGDVPITRSTLVQISPANVQYSDYPADVREQLSKGLIDTSRQIGEQAQKNYLLDLNVTMQKQLSRIEQENIGDPDAMNVAFDSFKDGYFKNILGSENRTLMAEQYQSSTMPALRKALEAKRDRIDGETATNALIAMDTAQQGMTDIAPGLFSKDPGLAFDSARQMQAHMTAIQGSLDLTKSDGTPMFTPEQRASKSMAARDAVFTSTAKAYLLSQPNKLAAYHQWQKDGLTVTFPDADGKPKKVNLRDVMPAETREKVDKEFTDAVKDQLSIESTVQAMQDRAFKKNSEVMHRDLMVKAQEGNLTLQDVEASKSQLEPDTYVDMRKVAISEPPLTNSTVYAGLLQRAYNGEDVAEEARNARFNDKTLSNTDYFDVVKTVQTQAHGSGAPDAISAGEKYLNDALGGLSQNLQGFQSTAIANAKADYKQRVEDFRAQNKRLPTISETRRIADEILPDWQTIDESNMLQITKKPKFMKVEEKSQPGKITPERLEDIRAQTKKYYLELHGNNINATMDDVDFKNEMQRLSIFKEFIERRAAKAAKQEAK